MKNYYKILQVDKDASPEIIKVAYKLLVKKNHPDLKEGEEKNVAEEKIKEINEAYTVLSDPLQKAEYDASLSNGALSQEQFNLIINENLQLKKELEYFHNLYNENNSAQRQYSNMYASNNTSQADPCNTKPNSNLDNKTNNIKTDFIEKIKTIIAVLLTFLIIFIILNIPFLRNFVVDFLESGYLLIFIAVIAFYIYFFRKKQ